MKRILYFGYFIVTTDYSLLVDRLKEVKKSASLPYRTILCDMIKSSFKYKASFGDYFLYEFYKKMMNREIAILQLGDCMNFIQR